MKYSLLAFKIFLVQTSVLVTCLEVSVSVNNKEVVDVEVENTDEAAEHSYQSYQTSIYCSPSSPILYPSSINEIQDIINEAKDKGETVKAIGSRHSLTDVICTDGIPVCMKNINFTILNEDGTATVGGGAEMKDVLEFLQSHGRTLVHVPTFGGITVAGAIGTGAHGSTLKHAPSLSDQAVKFTIVDGEGNTHVIDDPEEVKAYQVHLGLLGIVYDVTLKTVPLFKMEVHNYVEPETILLDGTAIKWAKEYDWYEMWWFPSTKTVVVSKGNYTENELPGNATTNLIPDQSSAEIHSAREAFETLQATRNRRGLYAVQDFTQYSLYQDVVGKPPILTEDHTTVKNPAVGYAWQLQSNRCGNLCAWENGNYSINPEESAMAFELEKLPGIIKTMKHILSQVQATFAMIGVFIRFSRPSDALMAITSGRPTVHLEWVTPMRNDPFNEPRDGIGAYQAILQAMVNEHGGRPHWGKNGLYYTNPAIIKATTPNREKFVSIMKKYDPNGIFINKFGKRLLGLSRDMDINPKVKRCALQDYCICAKNSDCADLQHCTVVNGYPICNDFVASFIPHDVIEYNPKNITSIYEAFGKKPQ